MEHQEYLSLVAELAVAFAGFTGIVAAFRFRSTSWNTEELANFSTMLRASISALFLSLLPYLLHQLIENTDIAWRIASAAVAWVMTITLVRFLSRGNVNQTPFGLYVMFPGGVIAAFINLLAVFNFLPASDMVILAVSWQLVVSTYNFVALITRGPITHKEADQGL